MRPAVIATVLFALCIGAVAADSANFPLKLTVIGESETSRELKRLWSDQCIHVGMGAPCKGYEELPPPGWTIDVVRVTGRVTQRGRTVEYVLECRTKAPK